MQPIRYFNATYFLCIVLFLLFVTATFAWTIDTTKYPTPPPRDTTWDLSRDEFDSCKFGYGLSYTGFFQNYKKSNGNTFHFDYVTIWMGDKVPTWNIWWIEKALDLALEYNKPLAIYAYIIANAAKENLNIEDCDVDDTNNLCVYGSEYLKAHWEDNIIPQYKYNAEKIAERISMWNSNPNNQKYTRSMLWFIEPDFQQYRAKANTEQRDGGVDPVELTQKYFIEIVSTIKKYQTQAPNRILTDISPWLNDYFTEWMELYPSNQVDGFYGGLNAYSDYVKDHPYNNVKYTQINQLYGGNTRPIFAQGGWGVDGADSDTYQQWLMPANLVARRATHVLAASFSNSNVSTVIADVESQLPAGWTNNQCYGDLIISQTNPTNPTNPPSDLTGPTSTHPTDSSTRPGNSASLASVHAIMIFILIALLIVV